MSQSTRSEQSMTLVQTPELANDAALQQVITERNSLRSQNDQLWKIIEKQRIIIQNLQKDVAKVTTERDFLRHLTAENEHIRNLQQNAGQYPPAANQGGNQHAKRPQERKAPESNEPSAEPALGERDAKQALGSQSASPSSMNDSRSMDQSAQPAEGYHPSPPPSGESPPHSAHTETELNSYEDANGREVENGGYFHGNEDSTGPQASYESETLPAGARAPHYASAATSSPSIVVERDLRLAPLRSDSSQSLSAAHNYGPGGRGASVNPNLAHGPHMPHLPPRSPRRERRDPGDNASSPVPSDNEDESYQPQGKKKGRPNGELSGDRMGNYIHGQGMAYPGYQDQDPNGFNGPMKHPGSYDPNMGPYMDHNAPPGPHLGAPGVGRKNVSAHLPIIPPGISPMPHGAQELSPASPSTGQNSLSTPVSPVAAIIDQDAEKFRMFMNKSINPSRKNVSAPIQIGSDSIEHAKALGQAVAMENIQHQIELQSQLLGQVQGHGGRGLNPVPPQGHWGGDRPMNPAQMPGGMSEPGQYANVDNNGYPRASGDGHHQNQLDESLERNGSQLSLQLDTRNKRESTLQVFDDYPTIAARTTSHQRDEDDSLREPVMMPIPPKRSDSHQHSDQMDGRYNRVASPTPSGNSSLSNALPSTQLPHNHRLPPTLHQQAFSMFNDNLEFVSVLVVGSIISTSDKGKEQLSFLVSIGHEIQSEHDETMYPHREDSELWRVEKQYSDFVNLDSKLRVTQSRNIVNCLPKLPDKSLFSTHAPSKVDARKVALELYLQQVTSLRIKDTRDLCEFLSTNVVERERKRDVREAGWKEGYLTKRGKNFGGWKTRYFMLRGPVLEYFDSKDGHHLGSISLSNAQIGRQQSSERSQDSTGDGSATDPNSYRHAFLILEPKKGQAVVDAKKNPNSVIRHVLCAETDEDRDEWVDSLMMYVGKDLVESGETPERERAGKKIEIQKLGATPIKELASTKGNEKLLLNQDAYERQQRSIPPPPQHSGRGGVPQSPTTAGQGHNMEDRHSAERQSAEGQYPPNSRGSNHQQQPPQQQQQQQQAGRNTSSQSLLQDEANNRSSPEGQSTSPYMSTQEAAEKKQKSRMTFWPKKATKEEAPLAPSGAGQQNAGSSSGPGGPPPQDGSRLRTFLGKGSSSNNSVLPPVQPLGGGGPYASSPARQVFGVSLEQAIDQARVQPGYELPAVVFRCIEYLNAHKAKLEEGIYRLNGSAAVIKNLKERFNQEGDVPLLASEDYYDIHAVAGLLKLFLRDLPTSVLTRELHKDFLQVIDLPNRVDRVDELTRLVAVLPEANYTLLRALTAHLIEIVENADVNKMTARNVGIVFSPTLGIPAGVFALLMSDFDQIFHTEDGRIMPLENSDMHEHNSPDGVQA